MDHLVWRLTSESHGRDHLLFWLVAKIPRDVWAECRATAERKARTLTYEDLSVSLLELALEKESDQQLNAYRPGGGNTGKHGRGYQGPQPGQGTTPKNACYMSNVQDLFWVDTRDEQGGVAHAPDCDQHQCFVVQGKKQDTNTCGTAKMPTTTGVPVPSVASASTTEMSATTISARLRMAVEAVEARAMARRARGSPKDEAKAKATNKAKVEDAEALTRSRRARTGPRETPTLNQWGPTLRPLECSKTQGLRPPP